MKPTYTNTISVFLSRKRFSREYIKQLDRIMKNDPRTTNYYTGMAGRNMCFGFPTDELKKEFITEFKRIFG